MTPEGRVKALIKREIEKAFPTSYRFMPVQNGMGAPGLDFFYCIHGWFVAIEAKAPGKTTTARQEDTAGQIECAGGFLFVVDGEESLCQAIQVLTKYPRANNHLQN